MKIEIEYLEKLVKVFNDNELTELSLEEGEKAIIIKKEKTYAAVQTAQAPAQAVIPAVAQAPQAVPQTSSSSETVCLKKGVQITAPMVGTFYGAPSPGAEPFVTVGKTVSSEQVVCIIEAMKLMNEIESEVSGKVIEVLVQDGQPVEYGQPLMIIDPS